MTKIVYYTKVSGESPPRRFIESLSVKQIKKVARILAYIEEYGLTSAIPHLKKLTGTPLWEIRILGQDNIRVFYAVISEDSIVLLHGFIKKSQETPQKEIALALSRFTEWKSREV